MNIVNLIEITDSLEQKVRAVEDISWEDIQYAMNCITEDKDKGLYGLVCYYAAYYLIGNGRHEECLVYLKESIRCIIGTEQEREMARCYNLSGVVAHCLGNYVLAMEFYGKAVSYARRYNKQVVYGIIVGNMADTYYRVGSYDRAITCYKECIKQLKRYGRATPKSENTYRNTLANYGHCLIIMNRMEEAVPVAEELKVLISDKLCNATVQLAIYIFLASLAHRSDVPEEADKYMEMAVQTVAEGCTISADYDNILNLIQYLVRSKKIDSLEKVLDCMEPQAAIERNEEFLLLLLLFRLQYCSDAMDQESFLTCSQTFFGLKTKYESAENSQVLRMSSLHSKLSEMEEEQERLVEENSKLLYQTEHDELSGLYNKRYLNRHMDEMFEEAMRKELPLGVLFVDIDHFKQMNDTYGHQKGDKCIVAISDAIKTCMPEDFAARYGGDEFVILTLGKSREYLEERAQMLVDNIKAREIPNADSEHTNIVTITVGAVHAVPHKPNKMWDFLSAADETLYQQKNEQKGCVRFYIGQGDSL